jgi:hypothetical protein
MGLEAEPASDDRGGVPRPFLRALPATVLEFCQRSRCRLAPLHFTLIAASAVAGTATAARAANPGSHRRVGKAANSKSGRDFAAWIGLVPRQHSTGGKERRGGISKQGDRYLRRLPVIGATAVVRQARLHPQKHPWIMRLLAGKPAKLVAVAVANKMARIAWAIMAKGDTIERPSLLQLPKEGLAMGA